MHTKTEEGRILNIFRLTTTPEDAKDGVKPTFEQYQNYMGNQRESLNHDIMKELGNSDSSK